MEYADVSFVARFWFWLHDLISLRFAFVIHNTEKRNPLSQLNERGGLFLQGGEVPLLKGKGNIRGATSIYWCLRERGGDTLTEAMSY